MTRRPPFRPDLLPRWTDEEEQRMTAAWREGGIRAAMAAVPERSLYAIRTRLHRLGVTRSRVWTGAEVARLRELWGVVPMGARVRNGRRARHERLGRLFAFHADERVERSGAATGDIVGVIGMKDVRTGDTLCDARAPVTLEAIHVPDPVVTLAVEPLRSADRDKLGLALAHLALEDPSLLVGTDPESGTTVVRGMGELHLEVAVEKLRAAGVEVRTGQPEVAYRETLAGTASADVKHAKQTGGPGQFARVVVEVSPLPRGEGFRFEDATHGGAVPREFVAAVEKGVRFAMARGVLAAFPVIDVRARLVDGETHATDSSAAAFEIAGSLAFQEAARRAGLLLLEPVLRLEVVVSDGHLGAVLGDIAARRGRVRATTARGSGHVVDACVPLRASFGYVSALRSMTQGRGSATLRFDHYAPAPPEEVARVVRRP